MLRKLLGFTLLFAGLALSLRGNVPQSVAQEVLDRLYATNGNYRFKKPVLAISTANNKVAAFSPFKNTITIDQKAYDICRSFGRDSLSALAYIIGHELVHAYQAEIKSGRVQTNFLAYNRQYGIDTRIEKVADVQGLFNAYLAGYRSAQVMPKLIEQIYRDYQLEGKNLPGYPNLEERKATTEEVRAIVFELIDLFDASNYLLVIGNHSLAISGYEHILEYYQGIEIHNNLGLAYTMSAQEFWNPQTDKYIYPLEADWYTKLARTATRGAEQADPTVQPLRQAMLEKAMGHFKASAELDPNYLPARINMVCALNLSGRYAEALKYADAQLAKRIHNRKKGSTQELEMAEIALAITYTLQPSGMRKGDAAAIFKRLSGSEFILSALYAQQNLLSMNGAASANVLRDFPMPPPLHQQLEKMQLGRTGDLQRTLIDAGADVHFARKTGAAGSSTYVFSNSQGNLLSILRFQNRDAADISILEPGEDLSSATYRNILAGKDGFYLKSPADHAVLKVDTRGRVLEMIKYTEHGR